MMNLIWPTKLKPNPTVVGWLGRVVHWSAAAFAVVLALLALLLLMMAPMTMRMELADEMLAQAGFTLFGAVLLFVLGRAARYFLSAE